MYETKDGYRNCLWVASQFVGCCKTKNHAEFSALILGLEYCAQQNFENLEIRGDSELVIQQLTGEIKLKHKKLLPLLRKTNELVKSLPCVPKYTWIPWQMNDFCDFLANMEIDRQLGTTTDDEMEYMIEASKEDQRNANYGFTEEQVDDLLRNGLIAGESDFGECVFVLQALYE